MIEFFQALWVNPLLATALIASLAAAIVSGVVGSYIVAKRIVFLSGGISHSILGGLGLCLWLERVYGLPWASPLYGALLAGILSALLIGYIHLRCKDREDTAIAALWSVGMAIGVLFISQTPGFNVELSNFLVGNVLWVSSGDLLLLAGLNGFVLFSCWLLHPRLLAICFDEQQARIQGIPVEPLYFFLLSLAALTIVLLVQVVGIILVMTMLALPAAIANIYTKKLSTMIGLAVIISCFFCLFGMSFAYALDWPPGATIALLSGLCYILALATKKS